MLSDQRQSNETLTEAKDTRKPVAVLDNDDGAPLTINELAKELLVSIFIGFGNLFWVRHVPLICKEWSEIYRSQDASPLHETLEVDFRKEF